MPGAQKFSTEDGVLHFERGFPLGAVVESPSTKTKEYFIYNHIKFNIRYHENPASFEGARVVGFELEPFTVKHKVDGKWNDQDLAKNKLATCNEKVEVTHKSSPQGLNSHSEQVRGSMRLWSKSWACVGCCYWF